jgi:hypothetical protein
LQQKPDVPHIFKVLAGHADDTHLQELINKQAEWSEEVKNYDAAAEMYIKVGA